MTKLDLKKLKFPEYYEFVKVYRGVSRIVLRKVVDLDAKLKECSKIYEILNCLAGIFFGFYRRIEFLKYI